MRAIVRAIAAVGLTLALATAPTATATTLAPLTIEQIADASTWVIRGTVTEVWTDLDERGKVWTHARVRVAQSYKGQDAPSEVVIDQMGGTFGAVTTHVPGSAGFSVDEDLFAFVYQSPRTGRTVLVSKYLGKYTVRRDPETGDLYGRRWEAKPGETFDARFLPHPAPENRHDLAALTERIARRVEAGWDGQPIPGVDDSELQRINATERRMPR